MRKKIISFLIFIPFSIYAQTRVVDNKGTLKQIDESKWTLSGTTIYSKNSGNVGIGVVNPSEKLEVSGKVKALGAVYTQSGLFNKILFADGTGTVSPLTLGAGLTFSSGNLSVTNNGTVTSVGLSMPSAFTVNNSPVTNSGILAVAGAGTGSQYIKGDGTLGSFALSGLSDVLISGVSSGQILQYNGTRWANVSANSALSSGNLTTTTSGLSVTNGTNAVLGAGTSVNYNLGAGLAALVSGSQGISGGTGSSNTYIGADGQQHLLPVAYALPVATSSVLGGVKIGTGINVAGDGTISTTNNGTVTSVTGTAPISVSTGTTTPLIAISRNSLLTGTSLSSATSAATVTNGTNAVVNGADTTLTINNTAPLWNANQINSGGIPVSASYLGTNAGGQLVNVSLPASATSITGTANQVLVNGTTGTAQTGAITLTLPQSVAVSSSPIFSGLTLSGLTTKGVVTNTATGSLGTQKGTGFLKDDGTGTITYDNSTYSTGNQTITWAGSGDVTGTTTGTTSLTPTLVIGTNKVTNSQLAQMPAMTLKGNNTAAAANAIDLTTAQVGTMLNLTGTNSGDVALSGQNYLSLSGQTITANPVDLGTANVTGILPITNGGTGISTVATQGSVVYGATATTLGYTAAGTSGQVLQSNGAAAPTWTNIAVLGTVIKNNSTAAQSGFSSDTYLSGSFIPFPGTPRIGTVYKLVFDVTKTSAGNAAPTINIRIGTSGTNSDAAINTLTFGAGTPVADVGKFTVYVVFRSVGSGTAVTVANGDLISGLNNTGLSNSSKAQVFVSSGFNSMAASLGIGASYDGGASASHTIQMVYAELIL